MASLSEESLRLREDAALLRDLTHLPGWDVYVRRLKDEMQLIAVRVLQRSADPAKYDFDRGVYNGMVEALHLPQTVQNRAEMQSKGGR